MISRRLRFLGMPAVTWLLLATGCVSVSSARLFTAGVTSWEAQLDGDVQFSESDIIGTEIDVVDLLEIDEKDQVVSYRGELVLGPVALEGRYVELEYEGDTILSETITFLGQDFMVNSRVKSRLGGAMSSLDFKFPILGSDPGDGAPRAVLGGLLGARYMQLEAELQSLTPPVLSEKDTTEVGFLVIGLLANLELPVVDDVRFFLEGTAAGFPRVEYDSVEGQYLELGARGGLRLFEVFSMGVGWRSIAVDFTFDKGSPNEDSANVTLDGMTVFAELRF